MRWYVRVFGTAVCLVMATGILMAATFTVVTPLDNPNPGSLRWAITMANMTAGADIIDFNILPSGPQVINVVGQLPSLTDPAGVLINGLTQPPGAVVGANPPSTLNLFITLNGVQAGPACGIWVKSDANTIQGLVIEQFMQDGILIEAGPGSASNNMVQYCIIGLDRSGTVARGNGFGQLQLWGGVRIANSPTEPPAVAMNNTVSYCLISDNYAEGVAIWGAVLPGDVYSNIVDRNYIGTDISGLLDFGNRHEGVCLTEGTHNNLVSYNLISGNDFDGVGIQGFNNLGFGPPILTHTNLVADNVIGLDVNGSPLPNSMVGVAVGSYGQQLFGCAPHNQVGMRNTIARNGLHGVSVWEDPIDPTNGDLNRITQNSIFDNFGLGIDLQLDGVTLNDAGDIDQLANQEENFPVIDSAFYGAGSTTVYGHVNIDTDPTLATVELFKAALDPSGYGEGKTYVASTTPNAGGSWYAIVNTLVAGDSVTSTVTDLNANTSEFSAVVVVRQHAVTPADTCTYYKKGWVDYCPNGMPDFDQKQNGWWIGMPPGVQWTHCGPVALANCMWWFDSKFEPTPIDPRPFYPNPLMPPANDNYSLVTSYDGQRVWDDHDTNNVRPLVDSLAAYALTNQGSPGTFVTDLANAASAWIAKAGMSSDYTVRLMPITLAFGLDSIKTQVLASQDVILLLGFYQETAPNYCERIGGHYVTVAGTCTDPATPALCISDPYFDDNERGAVHPSTDHNDASLVSGPHGTIHHDRYDVTVSPCGPPMPPQLYFPNELVNYPINPGNVMNFFGANGYQPWLPVPSTGAPLHALIEFAIIICPADTCLGQLPGDVNVNGSIQISDITALINILNFGAPLPVPPSNADPNGDCIVDYRDLQYLVDYINLGGPAPVKCTCLKPKLTCCLNMTGNVDGDAAEGVDISDLSALIDYLYISFTPPACLEEANCDGDLAGGVDISDLSALIDYLYISFTPVQHCL